MRKTRKIRKTKRRRWRIRRSSSTRKSQKGGSDYFPYVYNESENETNLIECIKNAIQKKKTSSTTADADLGHTIHVCRLQYEKRKDFEYKSLQDQWYNDMLTFHEILKYFSDAKNQTAAEDAYALQKNNEIHARNKIRFYYHQQEATGQLYLHYILEYDKQQLAAITKKQQQSTTPLTPEEHQLLQEIQFRNTWRQNDDLELATAAATPPNKSKKNKFIFSGQALELGRPKNGLQTYKVKPPTQFDDGSSLPAALAYKEPGYLKEKLAEAMSNAILHAKMPDYADDINAAVAADKRKTDAYNLQHPPDRNFDLLPSWRKYEINEKKSEEELAAIEQALDAIVAS